MKKLILITAALFLCTHIAEAGQNENATVYIDLDPATTVIDTSRNVPADEVFDVGIVIKGASNLQMFNLNVTFPQNILELQTLGTDFTLGSFLGKEGAFVMPMPPDYSVDGNVTLGAIALPMVGTELSDAEAADGDGMLYTIKFKVLSTDQADITFSTSEAQILSDNDYVEDAVAPGNANGATVNKRDIDPDQSTVEATTPVPVGETSTITITAIDTDGNPIPGIAAANIEVTSTNPGDTIVGPSMDTDASGKTTATISSTKAEEKIISVTINDTAITNTASVTFTAGGVAPGQSSVDATTPVPVGGTSTITITAKDAYGNPIPGIAAANIVVTSTNPGDTIVGPSMDTDASGKTTATISSTKAEEKTISVTINGIAIADTAKVVFTAGGVDAGQSSVDATTPVQVGGTSTITITAKDVNGNPIPGIAAASIKVSSSGTDYTITPPAMPTNASGQTTAAISSTKAEEKIISVTINDIAITDTATVVFEAGGVSAAQSSVDATTPVQVGGTSTITITAKDTHGNPIPDISPTNIGVSSTGTENTIDGPTTATDASGQTTATISSTKAETKTISVTVNGTAIGTASVIFTAGDPFKLDFTTSPGETAATAALSPSPQVTVFDKYGNLVTSTVPVNLVITDDTGTPGALLSYTTPVDTVDGVATFDNLTIDLAGTGYRLTAKSGTLASDDSELFDITADPVLTIEKSGEPDPVDPDETVEYKITYGNTGLDNATNIVIVETLPANLTYVSSTDDGVYDEAAGTITWTIDTLSARTTGKVVYFTAQVSDTMLEGGTIVNSNLTIDCDETEPVGQIVPDTTTVNDKKAPATSGYIPEPDSIQVARDTIIQLHITDGGSGVKYDGGTVKIYVEDDLVYDGSNETSDGVYDSTGKDQAVKGICRRVGTEADYMFVFQSSTQFDYEQKVDVEVSAEDEEGNILSGESYHFHTVMRSFAKNIKVNSDTGALVQNHPATATDSAGNIWVVWEQTTAAGDTDIYIGMLPKGEDTFEESKLVFGGLNNQSNPAIAIDKLDMISVVWQSYDPVSLWDIYASSASASDNGTNWSDPIKVSIDDDDNKSNQTSPAIAFDGTGQGYVAWEDDRMGEKDIWGLSSGDPILILKGEGDETEPFVIAHPVLNKAWVISTTDISAEKATDLFFAPFDSPGSYQKIVQTGSNQSNPVAALSGDRLHLLWVDDENDDGDIFYGNDASGLLIQGINIVDEPDTVQSSPAIAVNGTKIFACWQDARWIDNGDVADIYFTESGSGFDDRTNILVNDDGVDENTQTAPDIGDIDVDKYGNPYIVWVDDRNGNKDIYYAGATSIQDLTKEPVPVPDDPNAKTVPTTQANLQVTIPNLDDENAHVDPSTIRIGEVRNLSVTPPEGGFGLMYNFGPSGLAFDPPATIRIPLAPNAPIYSQYIIYWWDSTIPPNGAWTTDGIHNPATKSSDGTYLEVQVDHFSVFQPGGSVPGIVPSGGGGGGGCTLSPNGQGNVIDYMLPYVFYVVVLLIITLKDARKRKTI